MYIHVPTSLVMSSSVAAILSTSSTCLSCWSRADSSREEQSITTFCSHLRWTTKSHSGDVSVCVCVYTVPVKLTVSSTYMTACTLCISKQMYMCMYCEHTHTHTQVKCFYQCSWQTKKVDRISWMSLHIITCITVYILFNAHPDTVLYTHVAMLAEWTPKPHVSTKKHGLFVTGR